MSATKTKALVVVCLCIALTAIWFAIPSKEPLSDPDAVAPEATRTPESSRTATPDTTHDPEILEKHASSKPIAGKHGQSARDERLVAAYNRLKSVHAGGWFEAAFRVGVYGDPDEATEAILDLIENRADVTRESAKVLEDWSEPRIAHLQSGTYHRRIYVLTTLGLTRTKRAEEFLLNAYKNPPDLVPNKKYVQLGNKRLAMGETGYPDSMWVDSVTRRFALTGLLVLDEPKYSPMLEEDFYALVPDAERIYKKDDPYDTVEDAELLGRWGTLLDILSIRDTIRRRGTENPEYLLNPSALGGASPKYWNYQTKTAVPRQ